jgi:hypothetical protein
VGGNVGKEVVEVGEVVGKVVGWWVNVGTGDGGRVGSCDKVGDTLG